MLNSFIATIRPSYFAAAEGAAPSEEDVQSVFQILMNDVIKNIELNTQLCHFFNMIEILRRLRVFLREKTRTHTRVHVLCIPALKLNFDKTLAFMVDKTLLAVSEDQRCRNLSQEMRDAVLRKTVQFFQDQNKRVTGELLNLCNRAVIAHKDALQQDIFASLEPFLQYPHSAGGMVKEGATEEQVLASLFWQDFKASQTDMTFLTQLMLRSLHETQLKAIPQETTNCFMQHTFEARKQNGESQGFVNYNFFDSLARNIERLRDTSLGEILPALEANIEADLGGLINGIGAERQDFIFNVGHATTQASAAMDVAQGAELREKCARTWLGSLIYEYCNIAL